MTLVLFILILSLLIFVHEFGHFIVAKKSGIKVEEFGFGLPPRVFGKKVGETIYSLNLFPIGGFVRLLGEDGGVVNKHSAVDKSRLFYGKSILVRFTVLIAGVMMNLILGTICFSVIYLKLGIPTKTNQVTIIEVVKNSPSDSAGLKVGEIIFQINGVAVSSNEQFIDQTKQAAGKAVVLLVGNEQSTRMINLVPRLEPPKGEGPLGVIITDTAMKHYPWWQTPYLVLREGMKEALSWSGNIVGSLKTMAVGLITQGRIPKDLAGPIGIYQITGQAAKAGRLAVVQFIGILSINLAVLNILPLPALDGGRIIFLVYEGITKKKVNQRLESLVNNIGMGFLLLLMALITFNDILRVLNH